MDSKLTDGYNYGTQLLKLRDHCKITQNSEPSAWYTVESVNGGLYISAWCRSLTLDMNGRKRVVEQGSNTGSLSHRQ